LLHARRGETYHGSGSIGFDEENQKKATLSTNDNIDSIHNVAPHESETPSTASPKHPKPATTVAWLQPPTSPIRPGSYIQHRNVRGLRLESNTSDFENDVSVQRAQSQMLQARQQEHLEASVRSNASGRAPPPGRCSDSRSSAQYRKLHGNIGWVARLPTGLVSAIIFLILVGAGVAIAFVIGDAQSTHMEEEAVQLAKDTGQFFSEQLDKAILPLFSMAQFAVHLELFQDLPDKIGVAGEEGALPLNRTSWTRNITGVCDDPVLTRTFIDIATTIKSQSGMDGILANIQLAPNGVVCLLHPINNTQDFEDGMFLDNTSVLGLDLFHDPKMKFIALQGIAVETVGVAGPLTLKQCPECDPFLVARLPVIDQTHNITVDGTPYKRWGFATGLIAWTALVEQSGIYSTFDNNDFEFQLTRTDTNFNTTTSEYKEVVVVLAETKAFQEKAGWKKVSTSLETTNNRWVMTVSYDQKPINKTVGLVAGSCIVVAFLITILIYTVLSQKHEQADMLVEGYAQEARVATERNMTAYFAHELRNRKYTYTTYVVKHPSS
jgi:hypothetical protein